MFSTLSQERTYIVSEVTLIRYRIKDGKRERVDEWMDTVDSRREEAIETLQDEGVYSESAFLESRGNSDYLIFYMEADDIAAAHETARNSSHDIDQEFAQFLDDVIADDQPEIDTEPVYHLRNPERP